MNICEPFLWGPIIVFAIMVTGYLACWRVYFKEDSRGRAA